MDVPIYFFSRTGNSKKVAFLLAKKLKTEPKEIQSYKFPYFLWLILSFIPFLPVKSNFPEVKAEEIILCFPKWTFNCPPITYFLIKCPCKRLTMIITYKGWGKNHYEKFYKFLCLILRKQVKIHFINIKKGSHGRRSQRLQQILHILSCQSTF